MPNIKVVDSTVDLEFPDHKAFVIAYEPRWQKLRTGLTFVSLDEARHTIAELSAYIMAPTSYERQCRIWRASNYMNSVPIGQPTRDGLMRIPRDAEDVIIDFRVKMKRLMEEVKRPVFWDWKTSRVAITEMAQSPVLATWLVWHRKKLKAQRANPSRQQAKPELRYYLQLLAEVEV